MKASIAILWVSGGLVAGWATDAKIKKDNPPGVQYCVRMTPDKYNGLDLAVVAETGGDGFTHLTFNVNGADYPPSDGPFLYHIHENKVSGTDCAAAGGHLDPYGRGATPECDSSSPETCQVGDLSGKHGDIQSLPGFSQTYTDKYLSLMQGDESFLGDKSLVLHFFNSTPFACANWGPCLQSPPSRNASAAIAVVTTSGQTDPSLTTVTSTLGSGALNGSTITITKTIGGSSPYQSSQDLTTVTSTFTSGPSSGVVVTITKTVWRSDASPTSATVTDANGLLTTITSTQSAEITTTFVSTLPGPSLTTITSTYLTTTAVQLVTTYTSTLSGFSDSGSMTTVTSTASLPSLTTITSTLSSGDSSGSTITVTSTLSYTTVTSTTSDGSGSTITTTYTTAADGGLLGFTLSIGNPLAGTRETSSTSTTTTTETQNLAGIPTARAAQAIGALAVAVAVAIV